MRYFTSFIFFVVCSAAISACYDEPEFAMQPHLIDFDGEQGIRFVDIPNTVTDSLIIRVQFRDGDGDLGLRSNETDPLLEQSFTPVTDSEGNYVVYDEAIHGPYDCTQFSPPPNYIGQEVINDTLKGDYNPYFYNFEVTVFIKENTEFNEYDWRKERCSAPLGGRFSPLKEDLNDGKPLEGVIQYGFVSTGIQSFFRNDTVKLAVKIRDRALNESNSIMSRAFTLQQGSLVYVDEEDL
ncbi:hypothetical protein WJR50_20985 [Catalinimonas sp. 4WD22]|uniref:hypothetical protein n=1 Tax=Catalinimonas locisalis TaxID=3133978 RepID=UPI00310112F3